MASYLQGYGGRDVHATAVAMLAEARTEGIDGMRGVGHAIANRSRVVGISPYDVVMADNQFSFLTDASNLADVQSVAVPGNPQYEEAVRVANNIFNGFDEDNTNGATMYHADYVHPDWADTLAHEKEVQIGRHVFYSGKDSDLSNINFHRAAGQETPLQDARDMLGNISPSAQLYAQTSPDYAVALSQGEPVSPPAARPTMTAELQQILGEPIQMPGPEEPPPDPLLAGTSAPQPMDPPAVDVSGNLAFQIEPVVGTDNRLSSGWGPRAAPTAGASTYHRGQDWAAPEGTDVVAVAPGTVSKVLTNPDVGLGLAVEIDHGGGWSTSYGHMSATRVNQGDVVSAGQWIGDVGSTGISTGNHLHLTVKQDGQPVNPAPFVEHVAGTADSLADMDEQDVATLQGNLQKAGLYQGPIDGDYGPQTIAAVAAAKESLSMSTPHAVANFFSAPPQDPDVLSMTAQLQQNPPDVPIGVPESILAMTPQGPTIPGLDPNVMVAQAPEETVLGPQATALMPQTPNIAAAPPLAETPVEGPQPLVAQTPTSIPTGPAPAMPAAPSTPIVGMSSPTGSPSMMAGPVATANIPPAAPPVARPTPAPPTPSVPAATEGPPNVPAPSWGVAGTEMLGPQPIGGTPGPFEARPGMIGLNVNPAHAATTALPAPSAPPATQGPPNVPASTWGVAGTEMQGPQPIGGTPGPFEARPEVPGALPAAPASTVGMGSPTAAPSMSAAPVESTGIAPPAANPARPTADPTIAVRPEVPGALPAAAPLAIPGPAATAIESAPAASAGPPTINIQTTGAEAGGVGTSATAGAPRIQVQSGAAGAPMVGPQATTTVMPKVQDGSVSTVQGPQATAAGTLAIRPDAYQPGTQDIPTADQSIEGWTAEGRISDATDAAGEAENLDFLAREAALAAIRPAPAPAEAVMLGTETFGPQPYSEPTGTAVQGVPFGGNVVPGSPPPEVPQITLTHPATPPEQLYDPAILTPDMPPTQAPPAPSVAPTTEGPPNAAPAQIEPPATTMYEAGPTATATAAAPVTVAPAPAPITQVGGQTPVGATTAASVPAPTFNIPGPEATAIAGAGADIAAEAMVNIKPTQIAPGASASIQGPEATATGNITMPVRAADGMNMSPGASAAPATIGVTPVAPGPSVPSMTEGPPNFSDTVPDPAAAAALDVGYDLAQTSPGLQRPSDLAAQPSALAGMATEFGTAPTTQAPPIQGPQPTGMPATMAQDLAEAEANATAAMSSTESFTPPSTLSSPTAAPSYGGPIPTAPPNMMEAPLGTTFERPAYGDVTTSTGISKTPATPSPTVAGTLDPGVALTDQVPGLTQQVTPDTPRVAPVTPEVGPELAGSPVQSAPGPQATTPAPTTETAPTAPAAPSGPIQGPQPAVTAPAPVTTTAPAAPETSVQGPQATVGTTVTAPDIALPQARPEVAQAPVTVTPNAVVPETGTIAPAPALQEAAPSPAPEIAGPQPTITAAPSDTTSVPQRPANGWTGLLGPLMGSPPQQTQTQQAPNPGIVQAIGNAIGNVMKGPQPTVMQGPQVSTPRNRPGYRYDNPGYIARQGEPISSFGRGGRDAAGAPRGSFVDQSGNVRDHYKGGQYKGEYGYGGTNPNEKTRYSNLPVTQWGSGSNTPAGGLSPEQAFEAYHDSGLYSREEAARRVSEYFGGNRGLFSGSPGGGSAGGSSGGSSGYGGSYGGDTRPGYGGSVGGGFGHHLGL